VHNFNARDALYKTTNLEYTVIQVGFLIDYWTNPKIKSYVAPITAVVDIPASVAAIPGSGNTPVTFIHSADLAKMTAAALDLDKWDPISTAVGDSVTWNEFVRLVEEVRGKQLGPPMAWPVAD
jgi:nucleoside-diphosphate-sugar epimerase